MERFYNVCIVDTEMGLRWILLARFKNTTYLLDTCQGNDFLLWQLSLEVCQNSYHQLSWQFPRWLNWAAMPAQVSVTSRASPSAWFRDTARAWLLHLDLWRSPLCRAHSEPCSTEPVPFTEKPQASVQRVREEKQHSFLPFILINVVSEGVGNLNSISSWPDGMQPTHDSEGCCSHQVMA